MSADEDTPRRDDADRYAIYSVRILVDERRRLAETSLDGIGLALKTLREDGDLTDDTRVGILDRRERVWIINPWARGDLK